MPTMRPVAQHDAYMDLESRVSSFETQPRTSKKQSGRANKPSWPHPGTYLAKPLTLARAGFFYDGDKENQDRVTCFSCGKCLEGWEPDDDPFVQHVRTKDCAWASAVCALEIQKQIIDGETV
jgi:hypothetical protein